MLIYSAIVFLIAGCYAGVQIYFARQWAAEDPKRISSDTLLPEATVLVPMRNEAGKIAPCLHSLTTQDYPRDKLKIIVLDNHSKDGSSEVVKNLGLSGLTLIELAEYLPESTTFKKEALSFGVDRCSSEWVLTTDSDCIVPPDWAKNMVSYAITQNLDLVLGPIVLQRNDSFLQQYQQLDLAGLMVVTQAGLATGWLISGNGSNLLFRKSRFDKLGGHQDHQNHRSGDDLFLIQKIYSDHPHKVGFLKNKEVMVATTAESSWRSLFQQRLRWASKSGALLHRATKGITALVFVNSFLLLLSLVLSIWDPTFFGLFLFHVGLKTAADLHLLKWAAHFFELHYSPKTWLKAVLLNPVYIVSVGLAALMGVQAQWRGRGI